MIGVTEEQERLFQERMAKRRAEEEAAERQETEKLLAEYMERTGRVEVKP